MKNLWLIALLFSCHPVRAQPQNPRIRIRVVEDDAEPAVATVNAELSNSVYVDEIDSTTKSQLERVEQLLETEQYSEAMDMLTRLLETDLRKLAEMGPANINGKAPIRFAPLSERVAQLSKQLDAKSEVAAARLRDQIDPLARQWYEQAKQSRDAKPLQRILHEVPGSGVRRLTLIMLGDLALERAQFSVARRYYRLVDKSLDWSTHKKRLPFWVRAKRGELPSSLLREISEMTGPDELQELADIWARLTLVSILEGDRQRARTELSMLSRGWPEAQGRIGGVDGLYSKTLPKLLQLNAATDSQDVRSTSGFPTFAGNNARNWQGSQAIDIPLEPAWRIPLKEVEAADAAIQQQYGLPKESAGELQNRPCTYFPIVVGDTVLIKEETRLRAIDIHSGEASWSSREDGQFFANADYVRPPVVTFGQQNNVRLGQFRFLMSAADNLAVATFGARQGSGRIRDSALIGFDLQSQGAIQFGPVLAKSAQWSFHSAPLNDGNRCWVGKRLDGNTTQDFLACYDSVSGAELWSTRICSAEALGQGSIRTTSNFVLTKHEDTIFFSSHLGTVAAVNAESGDIRWLVRYQRQGPKQSLTESNWYSTRDLTPCLVHDDLVIVAMSDADQVLALHRDSGHVIWRTSVPRDATQLLGVTKDDQLILSGRRVWWLDAFTGQVSRRVSVNPFPSSAKSEPQGVGRGVLTAGKLYWPAVEDGESKIYVLDQQTGQPSRQAIDLSAASCEAGNLILAAKHLLIATPNELVAFKNSD